MRDVRLHCQYASKPRQNCQKKIIMHSNFQKKNEAFFVTPNHNTVLMSHLRFTKTALKMQAL